jgi:Uma2 family endonuclease
MTGILAEVMPQPGPDDESAAEGLYEIVDGERKLLRDTACESSVASLLAAFLGRFANTQRLGRVQGRGLFALGPTSNQRRPDVALVSYQRWPQPVPHTDAWDVAPDLAAEVVSSRDEMAEVLAKVREYFQAGARLVWLLLPSERLIYVYQSPTQIQVLTQADVLDGGAVVPGFQAPVATLFEDAPPPS